MEMIENSALALMIIFVTASLIVAGYNITFEVLFRRRRYIKYSNYSLYINMYNLEKNTINIGAIIVILFISIILFALFIPFRVVRIYLFSLIPIDASMGIFLYYELSRNQYNNKRVSMFNSYYKEVANIERSKNNLFIKIDEIEKQFEANLSPYIMAFEKFNSIIPNQREKDRLMQLLSDNRKVFAQNKNELKNYNTTIIGQFNEALSEFVVQGIEPVFEIQEFNPIDVLEMKNFINILKNEFSDYIKEKTIFSIVNGNVKKGEVIINLLKICFEINVSFTVKEVMDILLYCSKNVSNKSLVAEIFMSNNCISDELLFGTILDRDWAWCFTKNAVLGMQNKQLIRLYQLIIEKNAKQCCSKILNINTLNQEVIIEKVLSNTLENNACVQMMRFQRIIINNNQEFDDEVNMYENMAYAIKGYYSLQNPPLQNDWINKICLEKSFYEEQDEIVRNYKRLSDVIVKNNAYLNDVLMCFYEGELSKNKYVDPSNLINFYTDNLKTLNSETITCFNMLLSAVILKYDTQKSHKTIALNSLRDLGLGSKFVLTIENAEDTGKQIIKYLVKNKLAILIPIVNRTEKIRQSLDLLIKIR